MTYHLLGLGDAAGGAGDVGSRLDLGRVEFGPDFSEETPIPGLLEPCGLEVVGHWQSAVPVDPDYLIVAGDIEPASIHAALADSEYALTDIRQIVVPGFAGPGSDSAIRERLHVASIGPEEDPCPACGMFGGLHAEPPRLPHLAN